MFPVFFILTLLFIFVDGTGGCQIDCSVDSKPSYEDMSLLEHEITEMKIRFDSTASAVVLKKSCKFYTAYRKNMMIDINCKQREWQGTCTYYYIQSNTNDFVS